MRRKFHKYHQCPECKQTYPINYIVGGPLPPHFPFCSTRCADIDLLLWVSDPERSLNEQKQPKVTNLDIDIDEFIDE